MARRCCCACDKADLRVLDDRLTGNEGLGRQRAFDCQAYGSGVDAGQDGDAIPPGPMGCARMRFEQGGRGGHKASERSGRLWRALALDPAESGRAGIDNGRLLVAVKPVVAMPARMIAEAATELPWGW